MNREFIVSSHWRLPRVGMGWSSWTYNQGMGARVQLPALLPVTTCQFFLFFWSGGHVFVFIWFSSLSSFFFVLFLHGVVRCWIQPSRRQADCAVTDGRTDGWMAQCHFLVLWLIQLSIASNLVDGDWNDHAHKKQKHLILGLESQLENRQERIKRRNEIS